MTMEELGQGFHLVAIADHCNVRKPRAVRLSTQTLENIYVRATRASGASWGTSQANDAYRASLSERKLACLAERNARNTKAAERRRACALRIVDPMAVQASAILRDVLRELRQAD
jgi:hypothetical protein